jgi:cytochrome o ubiquinol oxidase subunit IV
MSDTQALHGTHGHGHDDHGDHHDDGGYHFSAKGYIVGFLMAVVLTVIPFWLVMGQVLPSPAMTGAVIIGFAAVQIVVHMIYFLHLNAKIEGGWSLLALIFTAALVCIMLAGSVWVMLHLNTNMMPAHEMPAAPR